MYVTLALKVWDIKNNGTCTGDDGDDDEDDEDGDDDVLVIKKFA